MKISAKYIVSVEGILQDSILKEDATKEAIENELVHGIQELIQNELPDSFEAEVEQSKSESFAKWLPVGTTPTKEWSCTNCKGLVELPVYANENYYAYCPCCGATIRR